MYLNQEELKNKGLKKNRLMGFVRDDFKVLDSITRYISCQFGPSCEVVLHDLTPPYDQTIVAIHNGHVAGWEIDGGGTNAGLEILRGTIMPEDQCSYISYTKDERTLRTSSKYLRDESGKVEGSLCINLDITGLLIGEAVMRALGGHGAKTNTKEVFTNSVDGLLDLMVQDAVQSTGRQLSMLTKEDKVAVVRHLGEKDAFLIKKSAGKVTDFLDISRFTIYNYLNEPQ